MADGTLISAADLRTFVADALRAKGVRSGDADQVAALMVEADIYGYGTHAFSACGSTSPGWRAGGATRRLRSPWRMKPWPPR